jgi:hypothetical protein
MTSPANNAHYWRQMAEQARVQADRTEDKRSKETILIAARSYDRMADFADERVTQTCYVRLRVELALHGTAPGFFERGWFEPPVSEGCTHPANLCSGNAGTRRLPQLLSGRWRFAKRRSGVIPMSQCCSLLV